MHNPGDDLINQIGGSFGDVLLNYYGEREMRDIICTGDTVLGASYTNKNEPADDRWAGEASTGQLMELVRGSPTVHNIAPDSSSPMIVAKKHKTSHNLNPTEPIAILHSQAGDLHSPMMQGNTTIPPSLEQVIQPFSWDRSDCFTPLAHTQQWQCDSTHYRQAFYMPELLTHRDCDYAAVDGLDLGISATGVGEQVKSNLDLVTPRAHVSANPSCENGEQYA